MQNFLKILVTGVLLAAVSGLSAQSIEEVRTLYNEGGTANQSEDLPLAIEKFTACAEMCETLYEEEEDEEAGELLEQLKMTIPTLMYKLSTQQLKNKQIKEGLATAYKAKDAAELYDNDDVLGKTQKIIPQVHYKIAGSYYKQKKFDGALAELDKAIAVNADYADAYYLKTAIYKSQDAEALLLESAQAGIAAAKATNDFQMEGKIEKLASGYFLKKGNDAKGANKYDEAISSLNNCIAVEEDNATAYYLLTSIYNSTNAWDEAIAAANKGLEYEDEASKARFYFELGKASFGKGDNAAACEAYGKAAGNPDYAANANYEMEHVVKCE